MVKGGVKRCIKRKFSTFMLKMLKTWLKTYKKPPENLVQVVNIVYFRFRSIVGIGVLSNSSKFLI